MASKAPRRLHLPSTKTDLSSGVRSAAETEQFLSPTLAPGPRGDSAERAEEEATLIFLIGSMFSARPYVGLQTASVCRVHAEPELDACVPAVENCSLLNQMVTNSEPERERDGK